MKSFRTFTVIVFLISLFCCEGAEYSDLSPGLDQDVVFDTEFFSGLRYRNIGPSRGGRATTVAGIPSQPSTFYMGATGGGVWKTTDYGQSWFNVSDGYFATGSIGAIRVAPSNADIVYVGTGSDGIRSNVITGRGVYKSVDAGRTWEFIGLRDVGQIGAVEIHPRNPNIVFVAAIGQAFGPNPDRGVYRTRDGGSTWEQVLFLTDRTGAVDLEFCPGNAGIIYASMWHGERKPWTIISGGGEDGIYRSVDSGTTWTQLTNGLPEKMGKSDIAVSPASPNRVYILIEASLEEGGLYRSDNRGESFRLVSTQASLLDRPFYYLNIDADPSNADVLYANSTGFSKSTDAGRTWQRRSTPHGDNHDIWINPNDPDLYVQANDGGVNVTRDNGRTWSTQNNQLTAEIYQVAVDDQFPYWVYGGQQDNSTIMVPSIPPYSMSIGPTGFWRAIGGCETGPAVPKPGNHNIVYANCKGRFGRYNKITGQEKQYYVGASNMYGHNPKDLRYRFQRVSPIHVSPHDPNVVYHASQYLHKTTDEGVTWQTISPDLTAFEPDKQVFSGSPFTRDITGEEFYSTIYAIQESPVKKGLIWVGSNDGPFHVTRDGGKNWKDVTPSDLPPGGRVQTVEPSPHRAGKAYFAVYRYLLNDWEPYIYRTTDYGETWKRLTDGSNGIPIDTPTRVIREDPDREGLLYAGTEFGMYISFDDGNNWLPFQLNLPVTPVTDIKIYRQDLVMSTMGRSFWIMDNLTPLHQLSDEIAQADFKLFQPRDAYRMSSGGGRGGGAGPEYPRSGVYLDYYIGEQPADDMTLEIFGPDGTLIRGLTSGRPAPPPPVPDEPGMREFDLVWSGSQALPNGVGMHRFIWDMSHHGSWQAGRGGRGGPTAVPGKYQAVFTVNGEKHTIQFNILVDPRVAEDGVTQADFEEQLALCKKVRNLQGNANLVNTQIRNALGSATGEQARKLEALQTQLVTERGRYTQPMLLDQISYLNSMINRADQKPGKDAYERYDEWYGKLTDIITELKDILQ
ncbi:WD40/YVTN/BNR-like repeat-containing protein [candidate division KSB1 bacterium]